MFTVWILIGVMVVALSAVLALWSMREYDRPRSSVTKIEREQTPDRDGTENEADAVFKNGETGTQERAQAVEDSRRLVRGSINLEKKE